MLQYQISWKSVQWQPSYTMRTEGRTDMTKLTVALTKLWTLQMASLAGATVSKGKPGEFPFTWFQVVTSLINQAIYMPVFYVSMEGNAFWDKNHKSDCRHAGNSTIQRAVRAAPMIIWRTHVAGCASGVADMAQRKIDEILTFLNISLGDGAIQAA